MNWMYIALGTGLVTMIVAFILFGVAGKTNNKKIIDIGAVTALVSAVCIISTILIAINLTAKAVSAGITMGALG